MELRHLRSFVEVAREGSITRAAEILNMSQPALSRQLKDLEADLGVQLIVRSTKQLTLTDAGELLFSEAQGLLEKADGVEAAIRGGGSFEKSISIGAGESPAMRLVARAAAKVTADHPYVRFCLYSADGVDITGRLDKGELDYAVYIGPNDIERYDHIRLPVVDRWGVLVPRDHPLAQRDAVSPDDLRGQPVIVQRRAPAGRFLSGWLGYDVDELHVVATYNLIGNAVFFVESGMGIALGIDGLVDVSQDSLLRFVPFTPALEAPAYLAWRRHRSVSPVEREFLVALRTELAPGR